MRDLTPFLTLVILGFQRIREIWGQYTYFEFQLLLNKYTVPRIRQIGMMPRAKQKFITEMLEALIKQQQAS